MLIVKESKFMIVEKSKIGALLEEFFQFNEKTILQEFMIH